MSVNEEFQPTIVAFLNLPSRSMFMVFGGTTIYDPVPFDLSFLVE